MTTNPDHARQVAEIEAVVKDLWAPAKPPPVPLKGPCEYFRIPKFLPGTVVDHICDSPECTNLKHMRIVY